MFIKKAQFYLPTQYNKTHWLLFYRTSNGQLLYRWYEQYAKAKDDLKYFTLNQFLPLDLNWEFWNKVGARGWLGWTLPPIEDC